MKIIAGLGNPGKEYSETRHNTGFQVIDKLAEDYNIKVDKLKHKAFIGNGIIKGEKIMLVKPQTYMNLSGESIREILNFYKLSSENLIVIYDDISLPIGTARVREKGSAGGQKGMKSIIQNIGTDVFIRVKVGIGEKPAGWDLADYVLSKFTSDEKPDILRGIEKASEAVCLILEKGVAEAMNKTNKVKKTPKNSKKEPEENECTESSRDTK